MAQALQSQTIGVVQIAPLNTSTVKGTLRFLRTLLAHLVFCRILLFGHRRRLNLDYSASLDCDGLRQPSQDFLRIFYLKGALRSLQAKAVLLNCKLRDLLWHYDLARGHSVISAWETDLLLMLTQTRWVLLHKDILVAMVGCALFSQRGVTQVGIRYCFSRLIDLSQAVRSLVLDRPLPCRWSLTIWCLSLRR